MWSFNTIVAYLLTHTNPKNGYNDMWKVGIVFPQWFRKTNFRCRIWHASVRIEQYRNVFRLNVIIQWQTRINRGTHFGTFGKLAIHVSLTRWTVARGWGYSVIKSSLGIISVSQQWKKAKSTYLNASLRHIFPSFHVHTYDAPTQALTLI